MINESYQDAAYRDINVLPPKTPPTKPTRGHFTITLKSIRATRSSIGSNLIARIKMWGESSSRIIEAEQSLDFHIKCRNTTFYEYLRDMQILKVEVIDRRNRQLFGVADVSMLLHLNKNIKGHSDSPLLAIEKAFPLFKGHKNTQLGVVQIRVQANFNVRVQQSPGISLDLANDGQTFEPKAVGTQIQYLPEEMTFKNLETVPMVSQPRNSSPIKQPLLPFSAQSLESQPRKQRPVTQIIRPPERIVQLQTGKLDAELLQLELQAEEILGASSRKKQQTKETLIIQIEQIQLSKFEDGVLEVSYPVVTKDTLMRSNAQLSFTSRKQNSLFFSSNIKIENWRKVKDKPMVFQYKSKKSGIILASNEVSLRKLFESQEFELHSRGKKVGNISLKPYIEKDLSEILEQKQTKKVENRVSPASPMNFTIPLLIGIYIRSGTLLEGSSDRRMYKIKFKLQNQYYETKEQNLNWNYNLLSPFQGKLDQSICFELWRIGVESTFEGIARLSLSSFHEKLDIQQDSINPTVLSDCKLPVQDLRGTRTIGYVDVLISIGTARQMSWKQQHQQVSIPARDQRQFFVREPTQSRTQQNVQTGGESSERERRLDTKYTEDKMVGIGQIDQHDDINLVETMTKFLQLLAQQSLKTSQLIKSLGNTEQLTKQQFGKLLHPLVQNDEELLQIVCLFFGQGSDVIDVVEFLKCFSSYVNFTEIIVEERTAVLQKALIDIDKTGTHLDVLQEKLMRHSQFGMVGRNKFRDLLKGYLDDGLAQSTADLYCPSEESTIQVALFINELKDIKFGRKLTAFDTKTSTFQMLIKQSVQEVLAADINATSQLPNTLVAKELGVRLVCEFLQSLKVQVSYWQALLLIESIKSISRQDNCYSGIISSETMLAWLNAIIESQIAANKSRQEARHNKTMSQANSQDHIIVQETLKTQKSQKNYKKQTNRQQKELSRKSVTEDDIVNIADLLKFKDKYEYTESEEKSKMKEPFENISKYSNLLPADSKFLKKPSQKGFLLMEQDRIAQREKEMAETVKIPPIQRFLKCQILDMKVNTSIDLEDLVLEVELINRHQILMEFKRNKPVFFSSTVLYEEVDVSSIEKYLRMGVKGLYFTLKHSGQVFCKGLIPLQDIFKLDANNSKTLKKTCLMYPKINNKIIFNISLVQDRAPIFNQLSPTIYTSLMSLSLRSGAQISQIHLGIDGQIQHDNVNLLQWYNLKLSSNNLSSKLQLAIEAQQNILQAEVSLQGFITESSFTAEVPINDQKGCYEGTVVLRLSKSPEVLNLAPEGFAKIGKAVDLHIFIEKIVSLTDKRKKLQVYWAIFQAGRQLSRTVSRQLDIEQHLSCISLQGVELIREQYNSQQQIDIRMVDTNTSQTYAISKITVNTSQEEKIISFVDRFCSAENKDKFPMRMGLTVVGVESNPKVKLDRIVKLFSKENRLILKKEFAGSQPNSQKLRTVLHDKLGYSYSQIGYILVGLNSSELNELVGNLKSIPTRGKCLELLSQFEFHDPQRTGFIRRDELLSVLGISGVQEKNQLNVLDLLTRGRLSVDYMRYLCYEETELPSGGESSFKEVYTSIDKIHESMLKRLNR